MSVQLKPLTPTDLDAFRELLGTSDFGGCFCAVWTSHGSDWEKRCDDSSQPNYFLTKKDLNQGRHVGYLVYFEGQLVGWTGSGPKNSFPLMETKLGSRISEFSKEIWSIGCLALSAKFRGQNLAEKIVLAVIDEAKANGAKIIEAYPVRPFHEPRMYRGSYKLFQKLGFVEIAAEQDGEFDILLLQYSLEIKC
jgi:GNAT superfamily N-acetyltransferase